MTARLPDWRSRLTAYVALYARAAYRPGEHDCCIFAGGGRAAVTGYDPMTPFKGRYSSFEGGLDLARAAGFARHFEPVVAGLVEIAPIYAQVGDLAVLDGADGIEAMGIVQGESVYVLHPRGAGLVPMTEVRRAWRV